MLLPGTGTLVELEVVDKLVGVCLVCVVVLLAVSLEKDSLPMSDSKGELFALLCSIDEFGTSQFKRLVFCCWCLFKST